MRRPRRSWLQLAVAVFVPMLLESDPKPLGEDVSVKIPPVDDGKFVNRLNEKDLKVLSTNRNVPEVLRTTARKKVVIEK